MLFREYSKFKIPSILHLTRLGYEYLSLKDAVIDSSSNIFTSIFKASVLAMNPDAQEQALTIESHSQILSPCYVLFNSSNYGVALN